MFVVIQKTYFCNIIGKLFYLSILNQAYKLTHEFDKTSNYILDN